MTLFEQRFCSFLSALLLVSSLQGTHPVYANEVTTAAEESLYIARTTDDLSLSLSTYASSKSAYDVAVRKTNEALDMLTSAQNEYANALVKQNNAEKVCASAKSDVETATTELAEATTAYEQAIENAKVVAATANKTYEDATAVYAQKSEAYTNLLTQEIESDEFKQAVEMQKKAEEAYKVAVTVATEAVTSYNDAKDAYDDAVIAQHAADAAQASAQSAKDQADQAVADAQTALVEAQKAYKDAMDVTSSASATKNSAQAAKNATASAKAEAEQAKADAEKALADAQSALAVAQSNQASAEKDLQSAKDNAQMVTVDATEAAARVAKAEQAVKDAQAQIALGSYGFFMEHSKNDDALIQTIFDHAEWMASAENAKYGQLTTGATNVGVAGDATSLENMKNSFEYIKAVNAVRVTDDNEPGLNPFAVSDRAMAVAQVLANASAQTKNHYKGFEAIGISKSEIAAWVNKDTEKGVADAIRMWYTYEKEAYDRIENGEDLDANTGHYTAIISPDDDPLFVAVTGLGVNTGDAFRGATVVQDFMCYWSWPDDSHGEVMSVEDYERDFLAYYNAVYQALADAEAELANANEAFKNQTTTTVMTEESKQAIANAQAKVDSAKAVVEELTVTVNEAVDSVNDADDALANAKADDDKAAEALADAEQKLVDAQADETDAKVAVENAQGDVEDAKDVLTAAENALNDAIVAVENATGKVAECEGALTDAENAKTSAEANKTSAKADYDNAADKVKSFFVSTVAMKTGESKVFTVVMGPDYRKVSGVVWSSNNKTVADVDQNGKVTAVKAGVAEITATTSDKKYSAVLKVTVTDTIVPVTGVSLNTTSMTINAGGKQTLIATVKPSDATNQSVAWTSSDEEVATVDQNGLVTGKKAGNADITVTTSDGKHTAICKVTVNGSVQGTYAITTSVEHGTITETQSVNAGGWTTVYYSPDNGYVLDSIIVDGKKINPVGNESRYIFVNVQNDRSINVIYRKAEGTATIITSAINGTITPTTTIAEGSSLEISYQPNPGYAIKTLMIDGLPYSTYQYPSSFRFDNLVGTHNIEVEFAEASYWVSTSATGGTITPAAQVKQGSSYTVEYQPDKNAKLTSLNVNGEYVDIDLYPTSYTFANIQKNNTISAIFSAVEPGMAYIRTICPSGGEITPSQFMEAGSNFTVSYQPKEGFVLESVKVNGTDIDITKYPTSYVIENVSGNTTVYVTYKHSGYLVNTSVTNGTISAGGYVEAGGSMTVSYQANPGYVLKSIRVNTDTVDVTKYPSRYTVSNVTKDTYVTVVFGKPSYLISTSAENGVITESREAETGETYAVSYAPKSVDYMLAYVKVDGVAQDISLYPNSYTFSDIQKAHKIEVGYKSATAVSKQIKTSAENGTISAWQNVEQGNDCTINYSANEHYVLSKVIVDGTAVDIKKYPTSYTFKNVTADHEIKVTFEKEKYLITTSVENGTISSSKNVVYGDSFAVSYQGNEGYELESIIVDGNELSKTYYRDRYTFNSVSEPHTIKVVYKKVSTAISGLDITETNRVVSVGESVQIPYTVTPVGASGKVTWSSSNNKIVTVDDTGRITAKNIGSAVISASAENGKYTDTCEITVEFTDVRKADNANYYSKVYWAAEENITVGFKDSDGLYRQFRPKETCTRGQMVMFLWKMMGQPASSGINPFNDVFGTGNTMKSITWAYENGVTIGVTNPDGSKSFLPDDQCTRRDAVMFLWKLAGKPDCKDVVLPFTDIDDKTSGVSAIKWAYKNNITIGYTAADGTKNFQPNKTCERWEIVTFMYKFDKKYPNPSAMQFSLMPLNLENEMTPEASEETILETEEIVEEETTVTEEIVEEGSAEEIIQESSESKESETAPEISEEDEKSEEVDEEPELSEQPVATDEAVETTVPVNNDPSEPDTEELTDSVEE